MLRNLSYRLILFTLFLFGTQIGYTQEEITESEIMVSLRMVGHQILLKSNDSTSRVLPIKKVGEKYQLSFDSDFGFHPDDLVSTIDSVIQVSRISSEYIVEVESCETNELIYSFKVNNAEQSDIVPCSGREQPRDCYLINISLLDQSPAVFYNIFPKSPIERFIESKMFYYLLLALLIILLVIIRQLIKKRNKARSSNEHIISLGEYQFDKKNTELIIKQQRIELTSKEADLLLLLYNAANTTVERDVILNRVWGDEGDYVGRTLDVFISKLRKKLEFDSKVKIVNIRGVGYKLVMN